MKIRNTIRKTKGRVFHLTCNKWTQYKTKKSKNNQSFNPFDMRSWKGRTKLRNIENRKYRRDKMNLAPHKKVGIAYKRNIY